MAVRQMITFLLFFAIYSFSGWAIESIYALFRSGHWVNRGFLHGPCIPAYGFGAILLVYAFQKVSDLNLENVDYYLALFFTSFLLFPLLECLISCGLENAFAIRWVDYRRHKLNLAGRFCLSRSFYLGCLGVVIVRLAHPALTKVLSGLSDGVRHEWLFYASIVASGCYVLDAVASVRLARDLGKMMKEWEALAKTLYQGLKEKQEEYERKFEEYDNKKLIHGQEWRQTNEEAKAKLMRDPGAGGETYRQTLQQANEDFRAALHQIKEEVAEVANERDMARQAFQEDVRLRIRGQWGVGRGRRRYKRYIRLFKAFPEVASKPVAAAYRRYEVSSDISMLTNEINVVGYVWEELKDKLISHENSRLL